IDAPPTARRSSTHWAKVAELVDALASGVSVLTDVAEVVNGHTDVIGSTSIRHILAVRKSEGEESVVIAAHQALLQQFPNLLLIL
ncbi:hypothetical protein O5585_28035, partial [Escherichia coli]|nr:hypothetical protein [Escherichia coli]